MTLALVPFGAFSADVWPGMAEWQLACWAEYLRAVANECELRDWTLAVSRKPDTDEEAGASVECLPGRKWAGVTLCAEFNDLPAFEQRHYVTHECVHCHTVPLEHYLADALEEQIGSGAWTAVNAALHQHLEHATDATAEAIARHLPLPEWWVEDWSKGWVEA